MGAKFTYNDNFMAVFDDAGLSEESAAEILQSGAEVAVKYWQKEITERGYISKNTSASKRYNTKHMVDSVKASKKITSRNGAYMTTVYPQGKDSLGVSQAEKAFRLHYGWSVSKKSKRNHGERKDKNSHYIGSHFVDKINEDSAGDVLQAMENKYNELKGRK